MGPKPERVMEDGKPGQAQNEERKIPDANDKLAERKNFEGSKPASKKEKEIGSGLEVKQIQ